MEATDTVLDPTVIESLRDLDEGAGDLLREILDLFLDDAPGLAARIREAVAAGNAEQLRTSAHTLKGSSANVGAIHISAVCLELQKLGDAGTTEGTADLLDRLAKEFDRSESAMRALLG